MSDDLLQVGANYPMVSGREWLRVNYENERYRQALEEIAKLKDDGDGDGAWAGQRANEALSEGE